MVFKGTQGASKNIQELFVMANRMVAGLELCDSFSLLSNDTLGRRNMSRGSRQFTFQCVFFVRHVCFV
jgi:hypothetical protein